MTRQELVTNLNQILYQARMSVDLFFVFNKNGVYSQFKADPNDELRSVITEQFSNTLITYTKDTNPYQLLDIYDDNEHADYNLFYDSIENNQIAKYIFDFDRIHIPNYEKEVGGLSLIHGFLIEISNGEKTVSIFKKNQPTHAVNPQNVINFFTGRDNKMELITQNTIYISPSVDVFMVNRTLLINNRGVYERNFGFVAELQNRAITGYTDLAATGAFEFNEELQEKIQGFSKSELKKLSSMMRDNPIIKAKNWAVIYDQGIQYAKHDFKKSEDGFIKITTQKDLKILISILNRDYNMNEASNERFITKNKQLIKPE